jgi:hypothetical protein
VRFWALRAVAAVASSGRKTRGQIMQPRKLKNTRAEMRVSDDHVLISARIDPTHAKALRVLSENHNRSEVIRRAIAAYVDMNDDARDRLIWNELPAVQLQLLAVINLAKQAQQKGVHDHQFLDFAAGVVRRVVRMLDEIESRK